MTIIIRGLAGVWQVVHLAFSYGRLFLLYNLNVRNVSENVKFSFLAYKKKRHTIHIAEKIPQYMFTKSAIDCEYDVSFRAAGAPWIGTVLCTEIV